MIYPLFTACFILLPGRIRAFGHGGATLPAANSLATGLAGPAV